MKTLHTSRLVGTLVLLLLVPSATVAGTASEDSTVALKVLTFNVQFREPLADLVDPKWPNTRKRAQAIGRAISTYDLIALQEVFHHGRRQEIIAAAEHAAAQSGVPSQLPSGRMFAVATDPVPPTPSPQASRLTRGVHDLTQAFHSLHNAVTQDSEQIQPMTNSGLLVLSRYPILSVNSYTYHARAGIDAWAKKGVLHVVVARGNQPSSNDTLDVFVTHLQAGRAHQPARLRQVAELADFIRSTRNGEDARPVLIMGDFNIDGIADHWSDPQSQYNVLLRTLRKPVPQLLDLWRHQQAIAPGGTNRRRDRRIDYIFVSPASVLVPQHVAVNEFLRTRQSLAVAAPPVSTAVARDRFPTLSDHAGVEATLRWERPLPGVDVIPRQQNLMPVRR